MRHAKRWLYLAHRWLGVLLSGVFVLWFVSGIVMMYVGYPKLTPAERLEHLPPLRGLPIGMEPAQALRAAGLQGPLQELRLSAASGGRAVYVATPYSEGDVGKKPIRRAKAAPVVIDASTGVVLRDVSATDAIASARAFATSDGQGSLAEPSHLGVIREDAFTHSNALDMHRPLHTLALHDEADTVVYVSGTTGEVVRDATRTERIWNYAGAWIHWLYPFRGNVFDRYWTDIVNWLSIAGVVLALTGTAVGILRWRFTGPRYKNGSRSPYQGALMKWHHSMGLLFALVTITWVFSGLMSMNPWKVFDSGAPALRISAMHGGPLQLSNGTPLADVRALLSQATPNARELRWVRTAGHTVVQAWSPNGAALLNATTAQPHTIDPQELATAAARLMEAPVAQVQTLHQYDLHYYDRAAHTMTGGSEKPLPVWRVVYADAHATWVHIDPRTGTVLGRTDSHRRVSRWLFGMLHSWDWLPLLERRPLWDVLLIAMSLGGAALSLTGVVVGWRRLRLKLSTSSLPRRIPESFPLTKNVSDGYTATHPSMPPGARTSAPQSKAPGFLHQRKTR